MDIKYILYMLLLSCVFRASAVLIIEDFAITPWIFTSVVFFIKCLSIGIPIRQFSKSEKAILLFYIFTIVITIFALSIFRNMSIAKNIKLNYSSMKAIFRYGPLKITTLHYTNTIILTCFVIDFLCIERLSKRIDEAWLEKSFISIIIIVLVFGIIQYAIVSLNLPRKLLENLLYSKIDSKSQIAIYSEYNQYRLFSTFSEPSYCGAFLSASFWYIFIFNNQKINWLNIAIMLEILLTKSSTAYGGLLAGGILYIIFWGKNLKAYGKLFLIGIIICAIIGITGYGQAILNSTIHKQSTVSGIERNALNIEAWKTFCKTYFWGAGFGSIRASSMLFNLLAEIGIIGTFTFITFITSVIKPNIKKCFRKEANASAIFLLTVLASAVIACPELVFSVIWLGVFLNIISKNTSTAI